MTCEPPEAGEGGIRASGGALLERWENVGCGCEGNSILQFEKSNQGSRFKVLYLSNNLHLHVSKTKELIVDYRKQQREGHSPHRHQWDYGGESQQLQVPRGPHH